MGNKTLYAVFDCGLQGMKDNGLLGVFTTKEAADIVKGNKWMLVVSFEVDKLYENGVKLGIGGL